MNLQDTIVALSSAPLGGREGVRAILRLSGPGAWGAAESVVPLEEAGTGYHGELAVPLVHATVPLAGVMLFRGPRSFTGEDVAEIHLPASAGILRAITDELLKWPGVRLAMAGEFSAQAFFNQKIDLTQAEGIAATIHAGSALELRAAASLRAGDLFRQMTEFAERLATSLALVEAGIDFSDEEGVSFIGAETLVKELAGLLGALHDTLAHAVRVDRVDGMPTVVFTGLPNVGKSSLMNALSGGERSIVSPVAGTTRDMLTAVMETAHGDVRLVDVAGEERPGDGMREKMMAARAMALLEADVIIEVVEAGREECVESGPRTQYGADTYVVRNKVDLDSAGGDGEEGTGEAWQKVSAVAGFHLELLREELGRLTHRDAFISSNLPALNQRHRAILQQCKEAVVSAMQLCDDEAFASSPELLASELRRGLDLLGQVMGAISPDEILGRIFSTFCIGK